MKGPKNKNCPCCFEKGTTRHEIVFYTCDKHNQIDVFKKQIKELEEK
jgi:hypothetical protein